MIRIDLNKKLSNFQGGSKQEYTGSNIKQKDPNRKYNNTISPSGKTGYAEIREENLTIPNPNEGKFIYQFNTGGIYRAQDAEDQQGGTIGRQQENNLMSLSPSSSYDFPLSSSYSTEPQLKSSTGYVFPYEKYDMDASTQFGEYRNVETADNFTKYVAGEPVEMPIDRDEFGNVDYTTQYNELPTVVVKPEGSFVQYRVPTNRALLNKNKEYQDQQLYVEDDSTQSQRDRLSNFISNNPNLTDKQKRIAQNKVNRGRYLQYDKIFGGADAWTDTERSGAFMGDGPDLENQERVEDPNYYSSLEGFRDDMANLTENAVGLLAPMPGLNAATGILFKGAGKALNYARPYIGKGINYLSKTRTAPSLNFARNWRSGRNLFGTRPREGYVDAFTMDGVKTIPKDRAVVFNRIEDANVTSASMDKGAYETGNWFESIPQYFYNNKVKKVGTFGDDMQFLNPRDNRRLITGYMDPDAASAFSVGKSTSTARGMSGGQGLPVVETEMVLPPYLTNQMRDKGTGRFFKSSIGNDTQIWDILENTFTNRPRMRQGGVVEKDSAQSFSTGGRIKLDLEKRLGVDIDKLDPLPIATNPKSRKFFQENPLAAIAYGTNPFRTAGSTRNMG